MKKIFSIVLLVVFSVGLINAQNNAEQIEQLSKKISKSDAEIKNPKKSAKPTTWLKRGDIFYDAANVNTSLIAPGLSSFMLRTLTASETDTSPFYGEPQSKKIDGEFEVWVYPKIDMYMKQGDNDLYIDHWVEKEKPFEDALSKSYEAYMKVIELDKEKKLITKKSTINKFKDLRDNLFSNAVDCYYKEDFASASDNIDKTINLLKYKASDDTTDIGLFEYYAGIFAFNAKNMEKAKKHFLVAINNEYEVGSSYQYVSQAMYALNDSLKAAELLEQGATKFPTESKIIYSLIDYYTPRGNYDKAFQYIDKAIAMTPDEALLYIVKANAYAEIFKKFQVDYFAMLVKADSLDKAAFKNRNNKDLAEKLKKEEDEMLAKAAPIKTKVNEYANKAIDAYKKGIEKDNNADYYYAVALFYYQWGIENNASSSKLIKLRKITSELITEADGYFKEAKVYGEKSYNLKPDDVYTIDLLSKVYYRLKMYDKSKEFKNKKN